MKAKVKLVALNRAEGPTKDCGSVIFYVGDQPEIGKQVRIREYNGHFDGSSLVSCLSDGIADNVLARLRRWGDSAPEAGQGYDKVDFLVRWDDGQEYEGRFDLQKGGQDSGESFWHSLRGRLGFFSCQRRPSHFKDESNWNHHCAMIHENGGKEYCEKILEECEI